jgi:hypothetical protein
MTHSQIVRAINLSPQQKTILGHLSSGKSISDMESLIVYQIKRLSDVIMKLRRKGFEINTDVRVDNSGHKYSRYTLAA